MEVNGIISTVIIGLIVLTTVALVIRNMWKKKKAGGSCTCGCSGCDKSCPMKHMD